MQKDNRYPLSELLTVTTLQMPYDLRRLRQWGLNNPYPVLPTVKLS